METIFLIDSVSSKRDYDRFGFDVLLKNKIDVRLWDFQKLYLRNFQNIGLETNLDISNTDIKTKVFSSFNELDINTELGGVFIIDFRIRIDNKYSATWFRDKGAIIVTLEQGLVPISVWTPKLIDQLIIIRNKLLNRGLKRFTIDIFRKFFHHSSKKEYSDIRVCSGSLSKCSKGEFEIRSHAFDYDIFLKVKDKKKSDRDYIIFLDSGMANHPDFQKCNIPPHATDEVFYPLLRSFFDQVEEQTSLPVIVAVHPRIIINDSLSMKFGDRELISDKTAQLVKDAKFIITSHDSTAINFVVLWKVPMVNITTDQIEKTAYREMESVDQFFKTNRLNINNPYNNIDFFEIAQKPVSQYNQYIEKFIKVRGSPDKHSAEILAQGLKKYVQ